MICKECNTEIEWRFRECKKNIQEYFGCKKCDNWCACCNKEWNKKLNGKQKH